VRRSSVALAFALAALLLPAAARAQRLSLTAGGFNVQRRVFLEHSVYQQTGLWIGGSGTVSLGKVRVGLSGLMGTLKGDSSSVNPDVTARATALTVQFAFAPTVIAGVQVEARRYDTDAGITSWRLMGGRVRYEPGLGIPGLRGLADVAVLPASSVSGGPSLKMALETIVGLSFSPPSSMLQARLGYRFERFDIGAQGLAGERYEQFRGLVVEVGVRLGR
jgi:hypothetical protein